MISPRSALFVWIEYLNKEEQFSYSNFSAHYLIIFVYRRGAEPDYHFKKIKDFKELETEIKNFTEILSVEKLCVIPKWKIAIKTPGSGNTANIGGNIDFLKPNFEPEFQSESQFEEYWRYKFDHNDALRRIKKQKVRFTPPYRTFDEYQIWVEKGKKKKELYDEILNYF